MYQFNDRLRTMQPYFVFDTQLFRQEVYLAQGISHFYTFKIDDGKSLRIVPDGCIDLFFEFGGGRLQGFACGTSLEYRVQKRDEGREIFGVRFMPGLQPAMFKLPMREMLGERIPIEQALRGDCAWLAALERETDFYQRIRVFIEYHTGAEKLREKPYGKKELVFAVKRMVYDSNGRVKINEISERTGYSQRYINKVFIEEMGFSPKTFCKILQFQRALEILNYGVPESMTNTAMELGYYDQPQFIRDFSKYAGLTPRKYLKLVETQNYAGRIKSEKSTDLYN